MAHPVLEVPNFPCTFDELVEASHASILNADALGEKINRLKDKHAILDRIQRIRGALLNSWSHPTPGELAMHVTFVSTEGETVYLAEQLPPHTTIFTRETWEVAGSGARLAGLSPDKKVVPREQVAVKRCPNCSEDHPVLRSYHRVHHTSFSESWVRHDLLVCITDSDVPQVIELDEDREDKTI